MRAQWSGPLGPVLAGSDCVQGVLCGSSSRPGEDQRTGSMSEEKKEGAEDQHAPPLLPQGQLCSWQRCLRSRVGRGHGGTPCPSGMVTSLMLTTTLRSKYSDYSHCIDGKLRHRRTWARAHSQPGYVLPKQTTAVCGKTVEFGTPLSFTRCE